MLNFINLQSGITTKSKYFPYNRVLPKGIDCSKFKETGKSRYVWLYETVIIAN